LAKEAVQSCYLRYQLVLKGWVNKMPHIGRVSLLVSLAMMLLVSSAAVSAQDANAGRKVANIVLVHGAFANGSSWAKVIPRLQAKGFNVVAVQNRLSSLADDVAAAASSRSSGVGIHMPKGPANPKKNSVDPGIRRFRL
jgi:hypothetical protein